MQSSETRWVWWALAAMLLTAGALTVPETTWASESSPDVAPSLDAVYDYRPTRGGVVQTLEEEAATYRRYRLRIPAAVRSDVGREPWIAVDYYEPRCPPPFPAVVILPHLAGGMRIEQYMCRGFAQQGLAALHVQAPYHVVDPRVSESDWLQQTSTIGDLVEVIQLVRQAVIEARQVADWLDRQPQIAPKRYGIMGISFGGNVAVLAAGVEPRFGAAAYLLSGGNLARLIQESDVTIRVRHRLQRAGVAPEDVGRIWYLIDPINAAPVARSVPTLMVNARFDQTMPRACAEALWQALGQPRQVWLVADHTSASLFAYFVRSRLINHFRNAL